jgi:hypothetical protein
LVELVSRRELGEPVVQPVATFAAFAGYLCGVQLVVRQHRSVACFAAGGVDAVSFGLGGGGLLGQSRGRR